jgi:hypothetical protein
MKNGKCTRCGASDIQKAPFTGSHRDYRPVTKFSKGVKLNEYVCCSCGFVETYLADMSDVAKIKKKCTKVETKE